MEQSQRKKNKNKLPVVWIVVAAVLAAATGFLGYTTISGMGKLKEAQKCCDDMAVQAKKNMAKNDSLMDRVADLQKMYDSLTIAYVGLDSLFKADKDRLVVLEAALRNAGSGGGGNAKMRKAMEDEFNLLKARQDDYLAQIDSLKESNRTITADNIKVRSDYDLLKDENVAMGRKIGDLEEKVKLGSAMSVGNLTTEAIREKKGNELPTKSAKKTAKLKFSFRMIKNPIAEKGYKDFYIRAIDADGNVMKDENDRSGGGALTLRDGTTLTYSKKVSLLYDGDGVETSSFFFMAGGFKRGLYKFEVYNDNEQLGSSTITLEK